MKKNKTLFSIQILAFLLIISNISTAQLNSPVRDWAGLTQYLANNAKQDSVYVFFSSIASPKKGSLKAKFSNGANSNFIWYKFDEANPNVVNPFVQFATENGVTESNLTNLSRGGYRVSITRISDNVTEVYTCWVMIDDVIISNIEIDNNCTFLSLDTKLQPSKYAIAYDYFTYWDLSKTPVHPEINKLGTDYFKNIIWHASNSLVTFTSSSTLFLLIQNTAPLYDSKYDIRISNPFGRILTYETSILIGKAPKADFSVFTEVDGAWKDGGTEPEGEAPLKMKLESKSINSDSIYWRILNDEKLFKHGGDSIVWRDSLLFTERIDAYPTPEKMIPGKYPIEHIAVKVSTGCRDTMTLFAQVDTSTIKSDAIPNVFSPNGDGVNDFFKLKEPVVNISSIKTFNIFIFSKGGTLVYKYSGNPKTWEGWNGQINGNKADAPDGVYYYIIEAVGWDKKVFRGGKYKGFLYLLRGK
ncbi:MAG: gliding motility-associated C-terminal domain-containing protein [Bacteroidales bacterium]|nr:gliding motility-associated C-terminal domain-containing protein [Bacteroidales bacterium]